MELFKGVYIVDARLGLYLERYSTLVIADTHIGFEAALQKQGIFLPTSQYPTIKRAVAEMLELCNPEMLVLNGDVKHEFGEATRQEWKETLDFLDFLSKRQIKVVVVRGNHDNYLIPILKRKGIEFTEELVLGPYLLVHGHKELSLAALGSIEVIISAHEHPAILVRDELGVRQKFKCFLKGEVWEKGLVVLPALSPLMEGSAINAMSKEELLSPLLRAAKLEEFEAYVVEEKVYKFPLSLVCES